MNVESLGEEWPDEKTSADDEVELRAPNRDNRFLEDEEMRSEAELMKFHGLDSEPNVADKREGFFGPDSFIGAILSDRSIEWSSFCENHFGAIYSV